MKRLRLKSEKDCHIKRGSKRHMCNVCNKTFIKERPLRFHMMMHTGEKPFTCDVCGALFRYPHSLRAHALKHTGEKPQQCEICGSRFIDSSALKSHRRTHTGEKPYVCDICSKSFCRSDSLKHHKFVHTGEKPYNCEICSDSFRTPSALSQHKKIHTSDRLSAPKLTSKIKKRKVVVKKILGGKLRTIIDMQKTDFPYPCDMCGASFQAEYILLSHRKTHTDSQKQFECEVCSAVFSRSDYLRHHQLKHTGEKPYQCDICKSVFPSSSSLSKHKRVHSQEKPYTCLYCGKHFKMSQNLKKHELRHEKGKTFRCEICTKSFYTLDNLNSHKRKHLTENERPYQCDVCSTKFNHLNSLKLHELKHIEKTPVECCVCRQTFSDVKTLNEHLIRKHPETSLQTDNKINQESQINDLQNAAKNDNQQNRVIMEYERLESHKTRKHDIMNNGPTLCNNQHYHHVDRAYQQSIVLGSISESSSIKSRIVRTNCNVTSISSGLCKDSVSTNLHCITLPTLDQHLRSEKTLNDTDRILCRQDELLSQTGNEFSTKDFNHPSSSNIPFLGKPSLVLIPPYFQPQQQPQTFVNKSKQQPPRCNLFSSVGLLSQPPPLHSFSTSCPSILEHHTPSILNTPSLFLHQSFSPAVLDANSHVVDNASLPVTLPDLCYSTNVPPKPASLVTLSSAEPDTCDTTSLVVPFPYTDATCEPSIKNGPTTIAQISQVPTILDVRCESHKDGLSSASLAVPHQNTHHAIRAESLDKSVSVEPHDSRSFSLHIADLIKLDSSCHPVQNTNPIRQDSPSPSEEDSSSHTEAVLTTPTGEVFDYSENSGMLHALSDQHILQRSIPSEKCPSQLGQKVRANRKETVNTNGSTYDKDSDEPDHRNEIKDINPSHSEEENKTINQIRNEKVSTGTKHRICNVIFRNVTTSGHLNEHTAIVNLKSKSAVTKRHDCRVCKKSFIKESSIRYHTMMHTGDKPLKCELCGATFRYPHSLRAHHLKHTGEKPFGCEICSARFIDSSNLQSHYRTHSSEKPYICNVCGDAFKRSDTLKHHIYLHTGEKPYKCKICKLAYRTPSDLSKHKKIHAEGIERMLHKEKNVCNLERSIKTDKVRKPNGSYQCDICGTFLKGENSLRCHRRIHTGEKPFKCDLCCAVFNRVQYLKHHLLKHTGEKPYQCNLCNATFRVSQDLSVHKSIHSEERPFKCQQCAAGFKTASCLRQHKLTHTRNKRFRCDLCGDRFDRKGNLESHQKKHFGDRPYQCEVCGATFKFKYVLNQHQLSHTGEKRHVCSVCGRKFGSASNKKKHELTVHYNKILNNIKE